MDGAQRKSLTPQQDWQHEYRRLAKRYNHFIKRYDEVMGQMQSYRRQAYDLEAELRTIRPEVYQGDRKIDRLEQRVEKLANENRTLKQRVADLTQKLDHSAAPARVVPAFVKANVASRGKKKPGRKAGHAAAHRPLPEKIDQHITPPLGVDDSGTVCCPECQCQLSGVQQHERLVEDLIPVKRRVVCYHTTSGYCPSCRKHIETRSAEQPPASDVADVQLGVNTLATAALMRIRYRLPYRLITQLMVDLPGVQMAPGTVSRQVQRMGKWLEGEYERLRIFLRSSPAVHMDETSWRVDGNNRWLWTLLDPTHTLFHVDKSRGSKVVTELLGKAFGGTLVTDFYSGYSKMDCRKQKCLVHLLRELRDTSAKSETFAKGPFQRRLKRLLKELLLLRKQKAEKEPAEYERQGKRLEERLKGLAQGQWDEGHAERLAKRLQKHEQELTRFLWEDEVEATNNAAERALRPAVVMRKITGGSRSERGAQATAVLMSVIKTADQQNRPLFETIRTLLMNAWAGKDPGLLTDVPINST